MSRVLVTGAAGFIGSHVLEALLARGDQVTALDNFDPFYDPAVKRRQLADIGQRFQGMQVVEGDIRDAAVWSGLAEADRPDAIIHLAALAGVRTSRDRPDDYASVNVTGTARVLEFARQCRVPRVILASSSSVYGARDEGQLSEGESTDAPLSPYAATKVASEALCRSFHEKSGQTVTVLRFFSVYGPRQRPDMAIARFARALRMNEPVPVFGAGDSWRDYTFVSDIVDGVLASLSVDGLHVYNLGAARPVRLLNLIERLARTMGLTPRLSFLPDEPGDARYTCANIESARTELGYVPRVGIDEGLSAYVAWLATQHRHFPG